MYGQSAEVGGAVMKGFTVKALAVLLSAFFIGFGAMGCVSSGTSSHKEDTVTIIATNFALYDFARVWESEGIKAEMLIAPGSESHDMEATLSDIAKIGEADVFLYAGGESDLWVADVFAALGAKGESIIRINALEYITGEAWIPHDHEEHTQEEHVHEEVDEHIWTSLPNALALIEEIGRAAELAAEGRTEVSSENAEAYMEKLTALDREFRATVSSAVRTEIAVADRFPFVHMAEEYGITYSAAFEGCSSNVEVPLAVINSMIGEVNSKKLPVVFYIEFSDRTAADAVCAETGAVPLLLHSCHNVTKAEFESGVTYLDLMTRNLEHLKQALH